LTRRLLVEHRQALLGALRAAERHERAEAEERRQGEVPERERPQLVARPEQEPPQRAEQEAQDEQQDERGYEREHGGHPVRLPQRRRLLLRGLDLVLDLALEQRDPELEPVGQ